MTTKIYARQRARQFARWCINAWGRHRAGKSVFKPVVRKPLITKSRGYWKCYRWDMSHIDYSIHAVGSVGNGTTPLMAFEMWSLRNPDFRVELDSSIARLKEYNSYDNQTDVSR